MHKWICVPMIALCLLTGCGRTGEKTDIRAAYREMEQCVMTAEVACQQEELLWEAVLQCTYEPKGKSTVEVLSPETIAGVRAVLDGENQTLEFEDVCLDAGPVSREELSPVQCLPQLMTALREGWLLEENTEELEGIPCRRLTVDQTGNNGGKVLSTLWLREEDGLPLRGEIAVDGEIILTAEFTDFAFCDIIKTPSETETLHGR